MSRTDKDTPYWADAEYWQPYHYRCGNSYYTFFGVVSTFKERECDLPPEPIVRRYNHWFRSGYRCCMWEPVWVRHDEHGRNRHYSNPPKPYVDHVWNNMTRVRVRDTCIEAGKQYRATGEVDIIPPIDQHRHCARWLWS